MIEHESQLRLRGERAVLHGARTLLGRPTSCVGRDWELGALGGLLDECIEESAARVVVMTAAAGMGKSRLRAEFVDRVRARHPEVAIWVGRGDSLRAGSTLDLLAQALRGALGLHEGEPLSARRGRLRARVAEHAPPGDRDRVAAFLGELVGTPVSDDHGNAGDSSAALRAARQDAQLMSELMRRAWLDFLHAEAAAHPVLLVLEDLHWGDFGTVRFIDAALRDLGKQPWRLSARRSRCWSAGRTARSRPSRPCGASSRPLPRRPGERATSAVSAARLAPRSGRGIAAHRHRARHRSGP